MDLNLTYCNRHGHVDGPRDRDGERWIEEVGEQVDVHRRRHVKALAERLLEIKT